MFIDNSKEGYIPGLDGLRAISVLIVMFSHVGFGWLFPGNLGVTIFFGISGFLITKLILEEIQFTGRLNVKFFYIRRFLRLYPELIVFIILCFIAAYFIGWKTNYIEFSSTMFYFMNYYSIYLDEHLIIQTFPWHHLWSLAVEEHFYILFPFLLVFLKYDIYKILLIVLMIIILAPLWRYVAWIHLDFSEIHITKSTDTRIDSIAWGCLLSLLIHFKRYSKYVRFQAILDKFFETISNNRLVLLIAIILILLSLIYRDQDFRVIWRFTLQGISVFIIIHNLIYTDKWLQIIQFLEIKPLRYIGRISYGLYIYHWLIFNIILTRYDIGTFNFIIISFLLSFLVSFISFHVVEKRMKVLRLNFSSIK